MALLSLSKQNNNFAKQLKLSLESFIRISFFPVISILLSSDGIYESQNGPNFAQFLWDYGRNDWLSRYVSFTDVTDDLRCVGAKMRQTNNSWRISEHLVRMPGQRALRYPVSCVRVFKQTNNTKNYRTSTNKLKSITCTIFANVFSRFLFFFFSRRRRNNKRNEKQKNQTHRFRY